MRFDKMFAVKLAAAALVPAFAFFGFVYSGLYSVAATDGHYAPVEWVLRTTMENSVRTQARSVHLPEGFNSFDRALAERAIGHYSAACATCHGAPGRAADPWMKIYPEAADLTRPENVSRWSDGELFWIIKHGIKDTGMLALGPTHKDEDIWSVTAFVRQLPQMSAADYEAMVERYNAARTGAGTEASTSEAQNAQPESGKHARHQN